MMKRYPPPLPGAEHLTLKRAICYTLAIIALLGLAALLAACSSKSISESTQAPKSELTLTGTLDGFPFEGVALGSAEKAHQVVLTSAVDVNMFTAQTCHRSVSFQDVIQQGWIAKNRQYSWTYRQAPGIEDTGDCILRLCSYSKTVGAPPVACAAVDFKNEKYALPFMNLCNGVAGGATGTAFCHTMKGLSERVAFASTVLVAPQQPDENGKLAPIANQCQGRFVDAAQTMFDYTIPGGECTLNFVEKSKPHRRAKLTVIPYDVPKYIGGN